MSTDKTYNGWTNYETWSVNLWLDNDGASFEEEAKQCWDEDSDSATYDLSKIIQERVEEMNPLNDQNNMFSDLLSAALSEVNWFEIAEHIIVDCDFKIEANEEEETVEQD